MKVILVDNFDRESVADVLLEEGLTELEAMEVAEKYNERYPDDWPWFARAVGDNYKLWRGIVDLI